MDTKIPLYANGEVQLVMKNSDYSTDLPTILVDIEYSELIDIQKYHQQVSMKLTKF